MLDPTNNAYSHQLITVMAKIRCLVGSKWMQYKILQKFNFYFHLNLKQKSNNCINTNLESILCLRQNSISPPLNIASVCVFGPKMH